MRNVTKGFISVLSVCSTKVTVRAVRLMSLDGSLELGITVNIEDIGRSLLKGEPGLSTRSQEVVRLITAASSGGMDTTDVTDVTACVRERNFIDRVCPYDLLKHNSILQTSRGQEGDERFLSIGSQGVVPCYHHMVWIS